MSKISDVIKSYTKAPDLFEIGFTPEFLREGSSVKDFMEPDRVVLVLKVKDSKCVSEIFFPLKEKGVPFLFTTLESAETIKYASNCFLAVKLSFINEVANFCDAVGANVVDVAKGMGLDNRIGDQFLKPGPGYGGSCFPKDTQAFLHTAQQNQVNLHVVEAAIKANEEQHHKVIEKISKLVGSELHDKTIAILGLAFKPIPMTSETPLL